MLRAEVYLRVLRASQNVKIAARCFLRRGAINFGGARRASWQSRSAGAGLSAADWSHAGLKAGRPVRAAKERTKK
jgi:hypothetical protein